MHKLSALHPNINYVYKSQKENPNAFLNKEWTLLLQNWRWQLKISSAQIATFIFNAFLVIPKLFHSVDNATMIYIPNLIILSIQ